MAKVNELHEKIITLAFAEAVKRLTESMEINSQMNKTPLFSPSFAVYERAWQEGQLAFFKVMGVKCRPLNPALSVRHKGKVLILRKATSKKEAVELQKMLRNIRGVSCAGGRF